MPGRQRPPPPPPPFPLPPPLQAVALINLSPPTTAAARGLIPSLDRFAEEELQTLLASVLKATADASLD